MKKVLCMICAVAICLGMAGCGAKRDPKALYVGDNKIISIEMSKEKIEDILVSDDELNKSVGLDESIETYYKYYENGSILIKYTNDIPGAIILPDEGKKYGDCFGVKPGMSFADAKKMFDNTEVEFGKLSVSDNKFIYVFFDEKNRWVNANELSNEERDEKVKYFIGYTLDESKKNIDDVYLSYKDTSEQD